MSDDATPQQLVAPYKKSGKDAHVHKGPAIPENPLAINRQHAQEHMGTKSTLTKVHVTDEQVAVFEMTPPHAKRVETEAYRKSHKYLIETQNKPCVVCGVSHTTLHDPAINRFGATAMESHHYPIERSLMNACAPDKVHHAFAEVIDQASLEAFVDSPRNLIVLCSVHHRSLEQGIHHLLVQDYAILPFLYDNYQVVASAKDRVAIEAADDTIMEEHNKEVPGD